MTIVSFHTSDVFHGYVPCPHGWHAMIGNPEIDLSFHHPDMYWLCPIVALADMRDPITKTQRLLPVIQAYGSGIGGEWEIVGSEEYYGDIFIGILAPDEDPPSFDEIITRIKILKQLDTEEKAQTNLTP